MTPCRANVIRLDSERINPKTGETVWEHKMQSKPGTGVVSTGGRLLFGGSGGGLARDDEAMEAYFYALYAENGKEFWRISLGGVMAANPSPIR